MNPKIGIAILLIILFLAGYGFGYSAGFIGAMKFGLRKAGNFVDIQIDEAELAKAIYMYKNRVDVCFPDHNLFPDINITEVKNASIHDD